MDGVSSRPVHSGELGEGHGLDGTLDNGLLLMGETDGPAVDTERLGGSFLSIVAMTLVDRV